MRELGPISAAAPAFPLAAAAVAPLRAKAERLGRGDFSPLWSGQNASGCKEIPAADLDARAGSRFRSPLPAGLKACTTDTAGRLQPVRLG